MNFTDVYNQLGILFIIMLVGYILGKAQFIQSGHTTFLSKFVVKVAMPSLLVSGMMIPLTSEKLQNAVSILILSIATYGLAFLLGIICCKFLSKDKADRNIYIFGMTFPNSGFMGFPIIQAIYGKEALFYAVIYNITFNVLVFTLGIWILNKDKETKAKINLKALINPGLVASILGMTLFISGVQLPHFITGSLESIGGLSTPLSMLTIGAILSELPLKEMLSKKVVYVFTFIKLIIAPLATFLLLKLLGIESVWLLIIPVVIAAMPVGTNTGMMAKEYDSNFILASQTILISTVLCAVTIPIVIYTLELLI